MTWPIVCDDSGEAVCSYCHIKTRHPCNSNNAKWCNNYATGAKEAFRLSFDEMFRKENPVC